MEDYVTGTGQHLRVHARTPDCEVFGCVIHNPSPHALRDFPTHWRDDRLLMERICPHGIGHPDSDHLTYVARRHGEPAAVIEGVHGCDGCCHKGAQQ